MDNIDQIVEEADIELCASGFDNFLMSESGTDELEQYYKVLNQLGALETAEVIRELLDWVCSDSSTLPLDVADSDKKRTIDLWHRYDACSGKENPLILAKKHTENIENRAANQSE